MAVKTVGLQPKNDPESKKLNMLDATISIKAYIFKEGDTGVTGKDLQANTLDSMKAAPAETPTTTPAPATKPANLPKKAANGLK